MGNDLKKRTEYFLKDLHARESMRLGWYRQWAQAEEKLQYLRLRKSQHEAFLKELLRNRGLKPAWYARFFYLAGHAFGLSTAFLPERLAQKIENTLESWIMIRYDKYLTKLKLDSNIRSMIESLHLKNLSHEEPGIDVLNLLESIVSHQNNFNISTKGSSL